MAHAIARRPSKNMLSGRYSLSQISIPRTRKGKLAPVAVNIGVVTGGLVLGLLTYPYKETSIGGTLWGAAGTVVGVGAVLLAIKLFDTV